MTLKEKLLKLNRNRWLDIGCNRNFENKFYYMDVFLEKEIPKQYRLKYFKINILKATKKQLESVGKFDLVRMQHVLEHVGYEDGLVVLKNVARILAPKGILIITVPDLMINIKKYLNKSFNKWRTFRSWAQKRIPAGAPPSFYFSVYAHSLPVTPHKWCYDYDGLKYELSLSDCYKKIKKLKFTDKLASYPFTHNRPEEDICIIANKK